MLSHVDSPQILEEQAPDIFTTDDVPTDGFFKLPPILKELAVHHPKPQNEAQLIKTQPEPQASPPASEEDLWLHADDGPVKQPEYMTWDKFGRVELDGTAPVFITEAGPAAFDALISQGRTSPSAESDLVDDATYSACLLNLALGRSSLLFSWDDEQKTFAKTAPRLKTSGLSLQLIQSIDTLCLDCANAIRSLQAFTQKTFSKPSTPTRVALAGVIDRLVLTVLTELGARGRLAKSILQLQSIVRPVHLVLSYFRKLVEKLIQQKSEEGMLTRLFQEVQSTEYRNSLLREAVAEVLTLTSKPWTDFVEEWIGLKSEDGTGITKRGPGKGFVKIADSLWIDDLGFQLDEPDFFLDEEKMPSFVATDVAQTIFETGRNLRLLREYHPEHPLSRQDAIALTDPPKLEWQFDWESIQRLEKKANEYRDAVAQAVQLGSTTPDSDSTSSKPNELDKYKLDFFGKTDDQIAANVVASMGKLDQPLSSNNTQPDKLATLLRARLYQDTDSSSSFSPHWSLVPLLSFNPVINVQSSVINHSWMKLLFTAHSLRAHINLLNQYYLMNNGIFLARLSHALFDTDLDTAERKAGVALGSGAGVMGLRLGGRDTWPPASSELRLALMGVLSDSYQPPPNPSTPPAPASRISTSTLPGDLSFAVRELSPEEMTRCMNPDTIFALDFLQLSYKTPPPLRSIITPVILVKYDRIFRFLLRLLRMLYIVNQQLFRVGGAGASNASTRLRIESRHFITQLSAYVFVTGITTPWTRFSTWLEGVEASLDKHNHVLSPASLQKMQETVLDEITSALLLKKRQGAVLQLLEEIFGIVLRFSKDVRLGGEGEDSSFELYREFRKKVEVFVTVCTGLGEKKADKKEERGDGVGVGVVGGENPIETLALMLDMGGFYGKKG